MSGSKTWQYYQEHPEKWRDNLDKQKQRYREQKADPERWAEYQQQHKDWWTAKMADEEFREKQRARMVEYRKRKKMARNIKGSE